MSLNIKRFSASKVFRNMNQKEAFDFCTKLVDMCVVGDKEKAVEKAMEAYGRIRKTELLEETLWNVEFTFMDLYEVMTSAQKSAIDSMDCDTLEAFIKLKLSTIYKGYDGGIMTDLGVVHQTIVEMIMTADEAS